MKTMVQIHKTKVMKRRRERTGMHTINLLLTTALIFFITLTTAQTATDKAGNELLAGIKMAASENGGPRNWEVTGVSTALNLREQPSTSTNIIARFKPGTILDNLGCKTVDGEIWCDVQQLGGGPRGYVSAQFLKPAVSPDGTVATGPDDSALRAGEGDLNIIRIGKERYEIPDAVVLGG
jgi:hypothetical protein